MSNESHDDILEYLYEVAKRIDNYPKLPNTLAYRLGNTIIYDSPSEVGPKLETDIDLSQYSVWMLKQIVEKHKMDK